MTPVDAIKTLFLLILRKVEILVTIFLEYLFRRNNKSLVWMIVLSPLILFIVLLMTLVYMFFFFLRIRRPPSPPPKPCSPAQKGNKKRC